MSEKVSATVFLVFVSCLELSDVPSESSEFAHPDIAIGFTILSYRYAASLLLRDVV
jgi:hypothetical protein